MKLTAIILLSACLTVSAKSGAQRITLSLKDVPLETAFKEIGKQTGYNFLFTYGDLAKSKPINLDVKAATLEDVLPLLFKGQPLTYSVVDKVVVVKQMPASPTNAPTEPNAPIPTTIDVSGKVTDTEGNPLAGASVKVKGTTIGTTTNADGVYVLKGIDENAILVFSYAEHETVELKVGRRASVSAALKRIESPLDEIQVIAYGTKSKRLQTGNVTTVKAADIEKQPVSNPILALQGRVPGLTITQATGMPGGAVSIRIQGRNNLDYFSGSDPLILIDGVPYPSQNLTTFASGWNGSPVLGQSSGSFNTSGSVLSMINPADIESIEVLKDADATAIYGSRAANGAILITTKKGVKGDTKVELSVQHGIGQVPNKLDLLNTQQYLEMRKEAFANDNRPLPSITTSPFNSHYDINGLWDTTRSTDWQKELIGGTANFTMGTATVSGGTENLNFVVGGTYQRETTVFPGDFANSKGSMHFNISATSSNKKFLIQTTGSYLNADNKIPGVDFTQFIFLAPNAPALYTSDGSINWAPTPQGNASWINPLALNRTIFESKSTNLVSNTLLSYKLFDNLEIKTNVGFNSLSTKQFSSAFDDYFKPEERSTLFRNALFTDNTVKSFIIEPQLNYKAAFATHHKIDVLFGTSYQERNSEGINTSAVGQVSDQQLRNFSAATSYYVANTNASYRYNALFGRLGYNYKNKYLLNVSARRDGSSRFGANNLFHSFGAVGMGWIFTEEKFLKTQKLLSYGKLKFSYGIAGNDQIDDYLFISLYSTADGLPYQSSRGLVAGGIVNPDLQWEETKKLQAGLDIGFYNDKVLITLNYYNNRTSNSLANVNIPITTGFAQYVTNFPALIQNSGLEVTFRTENIKRKLFSWSTAFNLTIPKNKLVAFPGLESSAYADLYQIGQPLNIRKIFSHYGVDPLTGNYLQRDANGNATSSPDFLSDRIAIINTTEQWYGGFQNTIQFKGFELDFLIQFIKQKGLDFMESTLAPGTFNVGTSNHPTTVLKRWQQAGDITTVKRYTSRFSFPIFDDRSYGDISYTRLKNLSLTYKLPLRKKGLKQVSVFLHGQNLFTITPYHGLDPETQSVSSLPPLRVITLGTKIVL